MSQLFLCSFGKPGYSTDCLGVTILMSVSPSYKRFVVKGYQLYQSFLAGLSYVSIAEQIGNAVYRASMY